MQFFLECSSHIAVIVPPSNAAEGWNEFSAAVLSQGLPPQQVVIIDSSSSDGTADLARLAGFQVVVIHQKDFSHGGTRQTALSAAPWATLAIYLTQDAILASL